MTTTNDDNDEENDENDNGESDPFEELPLTSHIDLEKEKESDDEDDDESWLTSVTKKSLSPPALVKENYTQQQLAASIDFYRYLRSELRDKNIKLVEYVEHTSWS
jgi:hypothetical protein